MSEHELHQDYYQRLYTLFRDAIGKELRIRIRIDVVVLAITIILVSISALHPLILYLAGVAIFFLITYGWKTLYYWYALRKPERAWRMMTSSMLDITPQEYLSSIEHELDTPLVETTNAILTESWIVAKEMLPAGGIALLLDIEQLWIEMYHGGRILRLLLNTDRVFIIHGTDEELSTIILWLQTRNPEIVVNPGGLWKGGRLWA